VALGCEMERISYCPAFYPSDLDNLASVFDQLCEEGDVAPGSPEAEQLASVLVWYFQSGTKDRVLLLTAVRERSQGFKLAS
jgi:hypothetical protein